MFTIVRCSAFPARPTTHAVVRLCLAAVIGAAACADGSKAVLNQQAEAHRLAAHLHVQFTRAADASNRAVMADTDEASGNAASEAQQARREVEQDVTALQKVLTDLGDREEAGQLDRFKARFDEYRKLDDTILPLAVENTNIKAQRLAFGQGQEAVDAFRKALDTALRSTPHGGGSGEALAAQATAALLEIQVMQARHIAESDEAAMGRMEAAMTASAAKARQALDGLKKAMPSSGSAQLTGAASALDRFMEVNAEIVKLSRRNSNVRSLSLSLGRKRTVTAECDDLLQQLEEALARHHFAATR